MIPNFWPMMYTYHEKIFQWPASLLFFINARHVLKIVSSKSSEVWNIKYWARGNDHTACGRSGEVHHASYAISLQNIVIKTRRRRVRWRANSCDPKGSNSRINPRSFLHSSRSYPSSFILFISWTPSVFPFIGRKQDGPFLVWVPSEETPSFQSTIHRVVYNISLDSESAETSTLVLRLLDIRVKRRVDRRINFESSYDRRSERGSRFPLEDRAD